MRLENIEGLSFNFPDAISAFKFDETDSSKATFHGAPMKAVDAVVELKEVYLFIEIKKYDDPADFDIKTFIDQNDFEQKMKHFSWLKKYLKYKYRDTFLYRFAEDKIDKPIHYLCILNFENALNNAMQKFLKQELPVGKPSKRWKKKIAEDCHVLSIERWNEVFPNWTINKYSGSTK